MKTQAVKRNIGHFFFKSREEQRAFASKSGKEKNLLPLAVQRS